MFLSLDNIPELAAVLAKESEFFVPADGEKLSKFAPWKEGMSIQLEGNTGLPPKDLLFPQKEKLYSFSKGEEGITVTPAPEAPKRILFGVRACDAASILRMDDVFLSDDYVDPQYKSRRENLTVIAIGCTTAAPTCFCTSFGLSPDAAPSADVFLTPAENGFLWKSQSEKGKKVQKAVSSLLTNETPKPLPPAEPAAIFPVNGIAEKLSKMFDDPLWDEIYHTCLGCGTCSYVCPTCYCFDINTEQQGEQGTSFRCWDSCQFTAYSSMAGGHNPRPTKKERVRNRILHKLSYFEERNGTSLCIGCGRCIASCPVGMDITEVITRVQSKESSDVSE